MHMCGVLSPLIPNLTHEIMHSFVPVLVCACHLSLSFVPVVCPCHLCLSFVPVVCACRLCLSSFVPDLIYPFTSH